MINDSRQHVHLISSEQSDGIRNLDRKTQNLIIGVSENQNTFDELKDLVTAVNVSSKEHISQEFQKVRRYWDSKFSIHIVLICQVWFEVTIPAYSLSFVTHVCHPEKSY